MVHRTPSTALALAAWLVSASCSAAGGLDASVTGRADTRDTATPTAPTSPDAVVSGYGLTGQLVLDDGADEALLAITTYTEDGSECTEPLIMLLDPAEPPEGEPLLSWWSVSIDPTDSACGVPADLFSALGIGSYDARLDVSLVQQGYESATPYGLYLRATDADPVWIVGLAGTEEHLAGEAPAEAPIVDGIYTVASLLQAPWPGAETTGLR